MNLSLLRGLDAQSTGTLLSRLLAIADDAVVVTDAQQRIVLFNEGAERIFGYRVAQVLGLSLGVLLPEAYRGGHEAHVREFGLSPRVARRMGERREIHGRRADGGLFDAEASISHIELDGRTFYAAILRDVSEARRARNRLAESEARFRGLAAAAPVGIFQTDGEGRCTYVNDRWCLIAGMGADEALGSGWLRALHPADGARVRGVWAEVLAGRTTFDLRYRFLRPDGNETWVLGNAVASHGADGEVNGYIGTITDITESHNQSIALERAKSEAEAAARAKSLFLANMSHEIRTPLNAVIGMTTLLLDTPMSEDQRDFARTIRASGENLLEIINDILDYSKADVGKLELEERPFDLRRCVEESLDLVTPRALEKNLNLAYLIEDGTPEALLGDVARVRQVLVNLLSNAVKFTHQGEVFVSVDGEPASDGAWRIRFAVKDTGIGIAAEQLPRLFQSFTQVDASTTRKYGGTGLGLAISKRLSELMGGGVEVQSEPGHGSQFSFHVRVRAAASAEPADFLQRNAPALAGRRILVVDDNLTNRRILTKLLLLWGMLPSTFPSALEALDRVRHGEQFDLAVLDMSMPEIDGMDLANEIRRQRGPEQLPIVMLTSLGQRQTLQAGQALSLAACLSKPIKASQLFNTLVAVLDGSQARTPSAPVPAQPQPRGVQKTLRVLVAEDNPINQRVALRLLQHLGYQPDLAGNGHQALAAVARQTYDVVLMDIQMPELDGLEAARQIVQRRGPDGLPRIIAMTANAMPGDREMYIAAGMDGYLPKPIELADLSAVLDQAGTLAQDQGHAAAEGVIDPARLEHLRAMQDDSQPSLVRELIDLFLADSPAHVRRLEEAHVASDAAALRALAHRFLSATQNIGATRLSRLCADLERLAKAGHLGAAAPLLADLGHERERVHAALLAARIRY
ncbi:PAS domain-containing hybrid sensor histidine kinase/response regulator [Rubrivivax sp. A210]|uniref:hybrid sensor histidine kinase/response regulator n=1 Tax=Rubrivivax sp. A210 TaxID=2772301 RepID=UPI00191B66D2|nr:PAS domain-containing hybrid sensor histidine kinase/response regulator [Rubrivivax sp. A210]